MMEVPEEYRITQGPRGSKKHYGNNGSFIVKKDDIEFNIIASDGLGWEHVSITISDQERCPTWDEMCHIKNLFWSEDDVVVQFHPCKKDYVNFHPYCLHLWRYPQGFPTPPKFMVA